MPTYIQVINNKVANILQSKSIFDKSENGWQTAPDNFNGKIGDAYPDYFNIKTGLRYTDKELIKQGKLVDNRGTWYNKQTMECLQIKDINKTIDYVKWTKDPPLKNETYQFWDGEKWVVDFDKKIRILNKLKKKMKFLIFKRK